MAWGQPEAPQVSSEPPDVFVGCYAVRGSGNSLLSVGQISIRCGVRCRSPGAERDQRQVTLPTLVLAELAEHRERFPSALHLFTSRHGQIVRPRNLRRRAWSDAVRVSGLDPPWASVGELHQGQICAPLSGARRGPGRPTRRVDRIRNDKTRRARRAPPPDQLVASSTTSVGTMERKSRGLCADAAACAGASWQLIPPLTCTLLERTTGFEPATPTLARLYPIGVG